jgi:hypothetical protein
MGRATRETSSSKYRIVVVGIRSAKAPANPSFYRRWLFQYAIRCLSSVGATIDFGWQQLVTLEHSFNEKGPLARASVVLFSSAAAAKVTTQYFPGIP